MCQAANKPTIIAALMIAIVLVGGCASGNNLDIEPKFKRTVGSKHELPSGTTFTFTISNLKENETLSLNLCGENCNSAYTVMLWSNKEMKCYNKNPVTIENQVNKKGRYYFWLAKDYESEKSEAMVAHPVEIRENSGTLSYDSGTIIEYSIVKPEKISK